MSAVDGVSTPTRGPPAGSFAGVKLAIVLPTLNEREGLRHTFPELPIGSLRAQGWKVRPLLVDGGSTDGTLAVAEELGIPVLTQRGRGKGAAIQQALEWLHGEGVAYAIVLDADFTYPADAIPPMAALLDTGSDVVVGVRYPVRIPGGGLREFVHRWGNAFLNVSASVLSERPILDLCSGLWGVRLAEAVQLKLVSSRFEVEAELFVKAFRRGLVFAQIPITYRRRIGEAKLRAARDGFQIFRTLIRWSATIGHGPLPERAGARRQTRQILTIAFVHEARDITIRAAPDRRAEADEISGELRRLGLTPQIQSGAPGEAIESFRRAGAPEGLGMTISLPARGKVPRGVPLATVEVPYRHRVVMLGGSSTGIAEVEARGFRHEQRSGIRALLSPLQAAHASVTSRRPRQESALLRANAYRTEIDIFQETRRALASRRPAAARSPDGREVPR